jgi:hypothetical protein
MSKLLEQIKKDQLLARKNRESVKATLLTTLLGEASPSGNDTVTDEDVMRVIQKFNKNAKEVLDIKLSRNEDVTVVEEELRILGDYMPKQLSEQEMMTIAELVIQENNIDSMKGLGQVMGHFSKNYKGQFDGKVLKAVVQSKLS